MRPKLSFRLVLSYGGRTEDSLSLVPTGSKGDKILTVVKGSNAVAVRLTGDELRAWKQAM